jgi:hypothetical protein
MLRSTVPLILALASPAGATTLLTTGIDRAGSEYLECQALNAGKKAVEVTIEVRAVTSPPPDFVVCENETVSIPAGRISGVEAYASDCGAAGPYYAIFSFKGGKSAVRAWCWALENPALRSEAR